MILFMWQWLNAYTTKNGRFLGGNNPMISMVYLKYSSSK